MDPNQFSPTDLHRGFQVEPAKVVSPVPDAGRSSGLRALRLSPRSYYPLLPSSKRASACRGFVLAYRCGAVPDSHRVPFYSLGKLREPAWTAVYCGLRYLSTAMSRVECSRPAAMDQYVIPSERASCTYVICAYRGKRMKPAHFVGTAREDLRGLPESAGKRRETARFQLCKVQQEKEPYDWKPMPTVGPGVQELRVRDESGPIEYCLWPSSKKLCMCFMRLRSVYGKRRGLI